MTLRLHQDEVRIDEDLVQQNLRTQLPDLANQKLRLVPGQGTDKCGVPQGLEALPYYLDTHPGMIAMARRVIRATLTAHQERPAP